MIQIIGEKKRRILTPIIALALSRSYMVVEHAPITSLVHRQLTSFFFSNQY